MKAPALAADDGSSGPAPSIKLLYGATVVLSAFLLFSVEPIVTRALLPLLGGSSAVWISALAFFQVLLLAGYGYAIYAARISARHRTPLAVHLALLAIALVSAATSGHMQWQPSASLPPQLRLFLLLGASIGLPFLVLSTTAPLLQAWYARREQAAVPYRLFGFSNLSSLAALLAYPFLIERWLTLHVQLTLWRAGFLTYTLLVLALSVRMRTASDPVAVPVSAAPEPTGSNRAPLLHSADSTRLLWFALPAVASMQLAAITEHLTVDVAAMPLLWVLPLAAYLLSFVLAFELPRTYRQGFLVRALAVLLCSLGYFLSQTAVNVPIGLAIPLFVLELLAAAWFLHAELYARRPQHSGETVLFYVLVAAGGAVGTLLVAVISPLLTDSNYDLPTSFLLTAFLALVVTWRSGWLGLVFWTAASVLGIALLVVLHRDFAHDAIFRARNFYGSLRVQQSDLPPEAGTSRILFNGAIQHGMQWFSPDFRQIPLTYYAPDSGVGRAIEGCCAGRPRRIGVIGLGAGTVAAYGRPGDSIRFYEINPLVLAVGTHLFSYTRDSAATVTLAPGDARLSLAAEAPQHFDVLVIDAFSGDSIPVHLLTREALALYRRHLTPGGIIAFHISNRYLDLAPVLARLAESTDTSSGPALTARRIDTSANEDRGELKASWVLLTADPTLFNGPAFQEARPLQTRGDVALWTDQYASLLPIVRWTGRD